MDGANLIGGCLGRRLEDEDLDEGCLLCVAFCALLNQYLWVGFWRKMSGAFWSLSEPNI